MILSNRLKMCFMSISSVMIGMGVISCIGGELIKTILFVGMAIWDVLIALLMKDGE